MQLNKSGVIEGVMTWAKFKAQTELNKNCSGKKQTKLKGIPKLEDANNAGTKHSIDCTLILTEGDSAKSSVSWHGAQQHPDQGMRVFRARSICILGDRAREQNTR